MAPQDFEIRKDMSSNQSVATETASKSRTPLPAQHGSRPLNTERSLKEVSLPKHPSSNCPQASPSNLQERIHSQNFMPVLLVNMLV